MDFPQFFQRPSRFQSITSRMFRGLAVLTHDPSRRDSEQIAPVTGEMCSDNDNPLHVILKPMKFSRIAPTVAGVSALPALPGVKYFIHTVVFNVSVGAAEAITSFYVRSIQDGATSYPATIMTIPSSAAVYNISQEGLDFITDENTSVFAYAVGADAAASPRITIFYTAIGGSIGG